MAQNLGDLNVRLVLDIVSADKNAKEYTATLKSAEAETSKLSAQSVRLSERIQNIGLRFIGFQALANVLNSTVKDLTANYQAQEVALAKLENGLKNVGEGQLSLNNLTNQASELQKTTPFGDEEIVNAQAMLTTFQKSGEQISILTPRMLDLAAAYMKSGQSGMDLQQIAVMLGKVNEDTIGTLRRVGVAFSKEQEEKLKSLKGTEQTIYLSQILDENFKGLAQTVGQTGAGQITIFNNKVGELKESLGKILQDAVIPLLGMITPLIDTIANGSEPTKRLALGVIALASAFVVLGTSMGGLPYIIGGVVAAIYAFSANTNSAIEQMHAFGQEAIKTMEVSENMKNVLDSMNASAENTAEAYDKIANSLYGMSKAQLESAKVSIEADIFRIRGAQFSFGANPPDDPAEWVKGQGVYIEQIAKLSTLLGEINNLMNRAPVGDTGIEKTISKGSRSVSESIKEDLTYLQMLNAELEKVNKRILSQTAAESEAEGMFIKKRDLEIAIQYVNQLEKYKKIVSDVARVTGSGKNGIELISVDSMTAFRLAIREAEENAKNTLLHYSKIVSNLELASNIVSTLSQKLDEGGRGFFYWLNVSLQIAKQIASLINKNASEEGIGFSDVLGVIGTILPFFLASGGTVPGSGSGDTVPAMLTPGEFVVRKSAVQRFGSGFFEFINGGGLFNSLGGHYANGGMVASGVGGNLTIIASGALTDAIAFEIVDKGMSLRNVKLLRSSY